MSPSRMLLPVFAATALAIVGCGGTSHVSVAGKAAALAPTSSVGVVSGQFAVYDSSQGSCLKVTLPGGASTTSCAKHRPQGAGQAQAYAFHGSSTKPWVVYGVSSSNINHIVITDGTYKQVVYPRVATGYGGSLQGSHFFVATIPSTVKGAMHYTTINPSGKTLATGTVIGG